MSTVVAQLDRTISVDPDRTVSTGEVTAALYALWEAQIGQGAQLNQTSGAAGHNATVLTWISPAGHQHQVLPADSQSCSCGLHYGSSHQQLIINYQLPGSSHDSGEHALRDARVSAEHLALDLVRQLRQ